MKSCKNCGEMFEPKRNQVHCSPKCAQKFGGRSHYHRNKEKRKANTLKWRNSNKDRWSEYMSDYHKSNPKKTDLLKKKQVKKPVKISPEKKERIKTYNREYHKNRRATDPLFKLAGLLRSRIIYAFKVEGYKKTGKTEELLGTDFETVKNHVESLFIEGMTWNNHGEWEIDHIKPMASANTEEELRKLCHFTNLQPLWKSENRQKSDKIDIY